MGGLVINAADGFAIAMLGMIVLSWTVLFLLFWTMRRQSAKRDRQVDALLEELESQEQTRLPKPRTVRKRPTWERNPDWWK
jgi:hypothetical protein